MFDHNHFRRMRLVRRHASVHGRSNAITLLVISERGATPKMLQDLWILFFRSKFDSSRKAKISNVAWCYILWGIFQILFQINILCRKRAQENSRTLEIAHMRHRHECKRSTYSAVSIKRRSFRRRSTQSRFLLRRYSAISPSRSSSFLAEERGNCLTVRFRMQLEGEENVARSAEPLLIKIDRGTAVSIAIIRDDGFGGESGVKC